MINTKWQRHTLLVIFLTVVGGASIFLVSQGDPTATTIYSDVIRRIAEMTGGKTNTVPLVWLLSYPFTGSSALLRVVQEGSNRSVATNYGDAVWTNWGSYAVRQFDSVPTYSEAPNGPFKFHHQMELPDNNILTKTFCAGYCIVDGEDCEGNDYVVPLTTLSVFYEACYTGTRFIARGKKSEVTRYNPNRVKKGVVLMRDPVEVLISRFGDRYRYNTEYSLDRQGFLNFCHDMDNLGSSKAVANNWYTEEQKNKYKCTVCHIELYKMVMWYNQAFKMLEDEEIKRPYMVTHFDDMSLQPDKTINGIFQFLGLKRITKDIPFGRPLERSFDWHYWFNMGEMRCMKNFVYATASDRTKVEFQRYFKYLK